MPLPYFSKSSPPETGNSRLSTIQANVRTLFGGSSSSIYSDSPALSTASQSPELPTFDFLQQPRTPLSPPHDGRSEGTGGLSHERPILQPLQTQHTAGSYQRAIEREPSILETPRTAAAQSQLMPDTQREITTLWQGSPQAVPQTSRAAAPQNIDPETEELAHAASGRRKRRRRDVLRTRPKAKPNRINAWVRRRSDRGRMCGFIRTRNARGKLITCILSAIFLVVILAIYLAIVVMRRNIGQEVHILFILVIITTTIIFCHALVRLCMITLSPPTNTPRMPELTAVEGFQPVRPIPVHLARDEELADQMDEEGHDLAETPKEVKVPPPAYGLWRCSVRVDPNLLHWQRVDTSAQPPSPQDHLGSAPADSDLDSPVSPLSPLRTTPRSTGPRPPSYASDDGITYVMQAVPRSMAPAPGVYEVHPAFRHPADTAYAPPILDSRP